MQSLDTVSFSASEPYSFSAGAVQHRPAAPRDKIRSAAAVAAAMLAWDGNE